MSLWMRRKRRTSVAANASVQRPIVGQGLDIPNGRKPRIIIVIIIIIIVIISDAGEPLLRIHVSDATAPPDPVSFSGPGSPASLTSLLPPRALPRVGAPANKTRRKNTATEPPPSRILRLRR